MVGSIKMDNYLFLIKKSILGNRYSEAIGVVFREEIEVDSSLVIVLLCELIEVALYILANTGDRKQSTQRPARTSRS